MLLKEEIQKHRSRNKQSDDDLVIRVLLNKTNLY